jgi:hypothetical protein
MLMTVMLPFLLIPVAGLAIDATIIHIVQTKLQAAVDAAALGAGRLLGTQANVTEIAGEFFAANFTVGNRGFWNSTLPNAGPTNPKIDYVNGVTQTITVNAKANVPTLFMRVLGFQSAQVSAVGTASRRAARVVFVLDRSGSMNNGGSGQPIGDVITWTQAFIKEFTPGVDEVGVIVFDGTGVVAYPSGTTYTPTPGTVSSPSAGGPDTCFWDTTQPNGNSKYGVVSGTTCGNTGTPDAVYQVGALGTGGGTGMADALSLAYVELQKAHLRDLAANSGVDNKGNAILLFTDGVPSAISLYANDPNHGGSWLTSSSGCTYYNSNNASNQNPIYFWLTSPGNPPYSQVYGGNLQLDSYLVDTTHTPNWYVTHPTPTTTTGIASYPETNAPSIPAETGCNIPAGYSGNWTAYWGNMSTTMPATDKWGNATGKGDGNGYQDAYFINTSGSHVTTYDGGTAWSGTILNPSQGVPAGSNEGINANQWGLAMWDATDSAAKRIRTDADYAARGESTAVPTQILVIGYAGDGGTDAGLLKRIANDPNDTQSPNALPSAWSSQPQGKFCLGTNLTTLQNCVNIMAGILLHLTR